MEEDEWRNSHEAELIEHKSWARNSAGRIMEEESARRLNHLVASEGSVGAYEGTWEHLQPSGAIWGNLKASEGIWKHLKASGSTWRHLEGSGSI